ncbi:hypothetical protein PR003_g14191 [Phytophthora rubi]|uniref:Uncharacterized protein n=1 Tax=Phytophthora rubi TaxID=129364 RepID=A0A6A4EVF6_9STRA|nr:hypothetical protein PR002_g13672 [Phytophthora rubi]KAE9021441.1 hypothetical protein PR001_g13372 [Phytophthora rubi]KAE9333094.1 hypothetical protein PR003_g14191 [Phytophthora rubi]
MEIAACKKDAELFKIMKGGNKPEENPTSLQNSAHGPYEDGSAMWTYLCERFEGTANEQTKTTTKSQLYAQLETAQCKQNDSVKCHLNYVCRLHTRLKTVEMTLDDAVFGGMLVSSLPTSE